MTELNNSTVADLPDDVRVSSYDLDAALDLR